MEKYRKFGDEATGYNPFLKHPFLKVAGSTKVLYCVKSILQDSRISTSFAEIAVASHLDNPLWCLFDSGICRLKLFSLD